MSDAPYSVLAIDQSMLATGWAHWLKGEKSPSGGLFSLPSWGDEEGKFLNKWRTWLADMIWDRQVTHLYIEDTSFALLHRDKDGTEWGLKHHEDTTEKLATFGLMCNALQAADKANIEAYLVEPRVWRNRFWGTERPPKSYTPSARRSWLKERSKQSCIERGWIIENHNIADAHGILDFAMCCVDPLYESRSGPLFRRAQLQRDNERRG